MRLTARAIAGFTNGGVSRLSTNGQWTAFTTAAGLAANEVTGLLIDSQDNKWFATSAGLSKLDSSGQWTTYTTTDGLAADHVLALAEDRQGNHWFGTVAGLSHLAT
ncbi:MAG: two-component regulator propeller domain-containing protein [Caldilineaceae bacterium]